ncbi:spore maturation protein CgeB [Clostridium tetanomorphum]|uniref:CgeB family protein n=1 Tax=Clostridium tetanomorphum TaxID=1553 RepID=UPI00044E6D4A|nr:glycosyltransferase [Clostridium tetanomorphum]KAJ52019.1 hypothetical protein CTM_09611 [Clostridium tetanomorphum DSM 665]MBP1862939.1 spore maturation protein CgeB [Clostridium tetanomorphum]NRS87076.1 spore maturation protein CgeB [Clostridium tetanomorphum]SQC00112.1 Uncharacterized protein conserved in bacteria [Clostridium tetanomorphum]
MKILFLEDSPLVKYGIGPIMEKKNIEVKYSQLYIDISNGNFSTLVKEIESFKPNAIFNAGMCIINNINAFLYKIKISNIKYIYWAIEDPVDFKSVSLPHALNADLTLTTSIECIPIYKRYGINAMFMMFGINDTFHKSGIYDKKFDHDIIFIGNNYSRHATRIYGNNIMLKPLIERNYDLKVYGNDWWFDDNQKFILDKKFYGGYCNYEEIPNAYSTAKIILGLHSVGNSSTMMSMRTFEVMGCSGFYLSQYVPSLEKYFTNKKHLVWCRNSNDTLKYIEYYLKHKKDRTKIAKNGQLQCSLYHNYNNKIDSLIKEMKLRNIWEN